MNQFLQNILDRLFHKAQYHITPKDIRMRNAVLLADLAAFIAHSVWIFVFYRLKVPVLFYYNIGSSLFWLFSMWFVINKGKALTMLLFAVIELIIHQVLAICILGWGCGFQYFLLCAIAFLFTGFSHKPKISISMSGIICLLYIFLFYYIPRVFQPHVTLSSFAEDNFNVSNAFITTIVISVLCHAYSSTVQRIEEKNTYFIKVFAHDIKNRLYSGILSLKSANKQHPESNQIIQSLDDQKDMNRMVGNLINVFSEDYLVIKKENVNSIDLINNFHDKWMLKFESKNINFQIKNELTESIYIDPKYMELVWENLFSNAFQHTPKDGKFFLKIYKNNNYANFAFCNSGDLIPEEFRGKMFEKYLNPEKHSAYNKGLGLNYSKMMAERHGGNLEYQVSEDGLNEFIVILPIDKISYQKFE